MSKTNTQQAVQQIPDLDSIRLDNGNFSIEKARAAIEEAQTKPTTEAAEARLPLAAGAEGLSALAIPRIVTKGSEAPSTAETPQASINGVGGGGSRVPYWAVQPVSPVQPAGLNLGPKTTAERVADAEKARQEIETANREHLAKTTLGTLAHRLTNPADVVRLLEVAAEVRQREQAGSPRHVTVALLKAVVEARELGVEGLIAFSRTPDSNPKRERWALTVTTPGPATAAVEAMAPAKLSHSWKTVGSVTPDWTGVVGAVAHGLVDIPRQFWLSRAFD